MSWRGNTFLLMLALISPRPGLAEGTSPATVTQVERAIENVMSYSDSTNLEALKSTMLDADTTGLTSLAELCVEATREFPRGSEEVDLSRERFRYVMGRTLERPVRFQEILLRMDLGLVLAVAYKAAEGGLTADPDLTLIGDAVRKYLVSEKEVFGRWHLVDVEVVSVRIRSTQFLQIDLKCSTEYGLVDRQFFSGTLSMEIDSGRLGSLRVQPMEDSLARRLTALPRVTIAATIEGLRKAAAVLRGTESR
jgi:hypothetical protein